MNTADVLRYGHTFFADTLGRVPREQWNEGGVCGTWSVQDLVAHLASCELFLVELLTSFADGAPVAFSGNMGAAYNPAAVEARAAQSAEQTLAEYEGAYRRVAELVRRIDDETLRRPGTLPWYGAEYALDDFIVYSYYGHKREHGAQIDVFADRLAR